MPDETKAEPTATETVTETKETTEPVVDYDKELEDAISKFETKEKNREGYEKRKQAETKEDEKSPDIQAQVDEAIAKALPKILPTLQGSLAEDTVETVLNQLSDGNESKKKLIRFHFENSVGLNGTLRERLENAALIADKPILQKKQAEMATALKNRAGLGASGLGSSSGGEQPVSDNILSADQLKDLKAKGWDDKKIERFKNNLRK